MTARDLGLDGDVILELASLEVDVDHLSGTEPSLRNNVALVQIHDSRLGHHVHGAVAGDGIPRGTEAVAIQARADGLAVAVHEQGGTVPRLEQSSVELVKVDNLGIIIQGRLVLVRRGDQAHERARRTVSALGHELEHGIQVGAIAPVQIHQRFEEVGHVLRIAHHDDIVGIVRADQILELVIRQCLGLLACLDPVDVADERVDLAVVSHDAHGLRERPLGGGIRAEPSVVDDEFGGKVLVL
mmetsp:Transcript_18789/g.45151  ORF Transcript_18789/g.45151 Transcript_18789/m.45151 type:complete len:242 (-) Transcript_18789:187-912(-)